MHFEPRIGRGRNPRGHNVTIAIRSMLGWQPTRSRGAGNAIRCGGLRWRSTSAKPSRPSGSSSPHSWATPARGSPTARISVTPKPGRRSAAVKSASGERPWVWCCFTREVDRKWLARLTHLSDCTRYPNGRLIGTILDDCPGTRGHSTHSISSSPLQKRLRHETHFPIWD